MVVASRIAWLRERITDGVHVRLCIGPAQDPSKCKIRAVVEPHKPPLSTITQSTLLLTLDALALACNAVVVVDRGHRHSSGISEAAFWLASRSSASNTNSSSDHDDDVDGKDEDDADEDGDKGPKRTLQPGSKDPWQDGNDPWSSALNSMKNQKSCPNSSGESKRPRKHAGDIAGYGRIATYADALDY